jgi:hypothetical protein
MILCCALGFSSEDKTGTQRCTSEDKTGAQPPTNKKKTSDQRCTSEEKTGTQQSANKEEAEHSQGVHTIDRLVGWMASAIEDNTNRMALYVSFNMFVPQNETDSMLRVSYTRKKKSKTEPAKFAVKIVTPEQGWGKADGLVWYSTWYAKLTQTLERHTIWTDQERTKKYRVVGVSFTLSGQAWFDPGTADACDILETSVRVAFEKFMGTRGIPKSGDKCGCCGGDTRLSASVRKFLCEGCSVSADWFGKQPWGEHGREETSLPSTKAEYSTDKMMVGSLLHLEDDDVYTQHFWRCQRDVFAVVYSVGRR